MLYGYPQSIHRSIFPSLKTQKHIHVYIPVPVPATNNNLNSLSKCRM
jgi:hypothetical protein